MSRYVCFDSPYTTPIVVCTSHNIRQSCGGWLYDRGLAKLTSGWSLLHTTQLHYLILRSLLYRMSMSYVGENSRDESVDREYRKRFAITRGLWRFMLCEDVWHYNLFHATRVMSFFKSSPFATIRRSIWKNLHVHLYVAGRLIFVSFPILISSALSIVSDGLFYLFCLKKKEHFELEVLGYEKMTWRA